ncbi:arginine N-succinyltransferase [Motiliproteus coralliicola]|uniref:Arginine N-succinyltransferase n=1 Tax=Motiliproteus coralliicola TaxID=2283196 RepID=A0A369WDJ5_9GAMM|nr:arginine N-succinyltransferase [Motiliproteus coralliicola]RDE18764.1 arginine N-succinyltransferase [Motiliproteus coralliicola]
MNVIRPIERDDLSALLRIAELSGPGFTSLPLHPELLEQRINQSIASLQLASGRLDGDHYLFVLEHGETGEVIGTTAISSRVGMRDPWYHYRIGTVVHASREMGIHNRFNTLYLCNDYTGHSEVCSLFLDPAYRRDRNGTLLSKCRFLFMAQFPERFAERVIAEMRGVSNDAGGSPFWEGLGRHFFSMEFSEADYLTGLGNKSFIAELMPKHSIYIHLLPESAQQVIGEVHRNTRPARKMLEDEGFHFEGYVDIFDAGPTLICRLSDIRSVCYSERQQLSKVVNKLPPGQACLLANTRLQGFRCILTELPYFPEGQLQLSRIQAEALQVEPGDGLRLVPLALTRKRSQVESAGEPHE